MEQMLEQGHKGGASQVESRGSMLWEVGQHEQGNHGVKKDLVDAFRSPKRFSRSVVHMLLLDHRLYAKYCPRTLGPRLTPKRSVSSLSPTISLHPPYTAPLGYPVSFFFSSMLGELHNPWPALGTQSTPSSLLQDLAYCHQIHLEWDFCSFSIFFTVE